MIEIAPLQPHQVMDAKYIVCAVAQRIFLPEGTPQGFYDILEEENELQDMDDYQKIYEQDQGLFLVVLDDKRVVGTGGLKRMDEKTAELKRLWLLEEYHGRGIGYRVIRQLFKFASEHHYSHVRLQTNHVQSRAVEFYKKLGFYDIESYQENLDDISMEIKL